MLQGLQLFGKSQARAVLAQSIYVVKSQRARFFGVNILQINRNRMTQKRKFEHGNMGFQVKIIHGESAKQAIDVHIEASLFESLSPRRLRRTFSIAEKASRQRQFPYPRV